MFISFEGIDGSGKSTQARLLASALRGQGREVVEVREPGGTDLGEVLRSLVLDPKRSIVPQAELLVFSAARAQLVAEVIRPSLDSGQTVVADRYADSSTAYQGAGRGVAARKWFETFNSFVCQGLWPDRTFVLDLPSEIAAGRRGGTPRDRIESETRRFYNRVRQQYLALAAQYPERIVVLDGTREPVELHRTVLTEIAELSTKERAPS